MHKNRLSAAQPVHQRQSLASCCDCLKQPRRIRPVPFRSKEFEMVETRPRRRIRVIHVLPAKRVQTREGHLHQTAEATGRDGARLVKADVTEDGAQNVEPNDDLDDEDDYAGPLARFLPVYGFESPFHPKNYFGSEESLGGPDARLRAFAEQLVHTILDDALLEFTALWGLILPDEDVLEERRRRRSSGGERDNGYVVHGEGGSDTWSMGETRSRCDFELDRLPTSGWNHGFDNASFSNAATDPDSEQLANGYGHDLATVCTSSPYLPRAWQRISRKSLHNRACAAPRLGEELDAVDPLAKFTYHPTGDDTVSQPESSFQSSTWGSSTNSSMRYVRRFTSKRPKTKPLMMFIHGIGDSAELWRRQLDFFQERGYEALAMDLIGHGMSCAPSDRKAYTFHAILTDVLIVFDRYSKDRNIVIGHSYGSCFAAALARHRPKQVTHLILLSGGGPFPLCPQPSKVCLPNCFTTCFQAFLACGTRRKVFYMPSRKQTRLIQSLDIPSYVLKHMTKGQVWLEGDASFHKQITIPTLLIYGLRDQYVTLVEECEMEKTIPRAFLELIPEASHMIMLDAPDQVNDMIYKFLRRWGR